MRRIDELTLEINQTSLELEDTKRELNILFKQLRSFKRKIEDGMEIDQKEYEDCIFNNKLLQMKRRRLVTHLRFLNKEFYEILY
ncbi:MAG: hypothetical protein IKV87_01335 [Methanobrevibacter sp.]|nr:hypothetical protein [Methanobrevibacter sp.]